MSILNNKSNYPIGFYDSGVGGLSVLKEVEKILPNEKFLYYGDTLHVPYGEKTKEQLFSYSTDILNFFKQKHCKAVVMACNTVSSVIYSDIYTNYDFKIYPVVQSVAKILSQFNVEKLGVFATKATVDSNTYQKEIQKYNPKIKVFSQYCKDWVNIVENNLYNDSVSIEIIKSDVDKMMKNSPDKIILGCTHYPFLVDVISRFYPKDIFVDPAPILAQFIKNDLSENNLLNHSTQTFAKEFYVSSSPAKFKTGTKKFYEIDNEPILLTF